MRLLFGIGLGACAALLALSRTRRPAFAVLEAAEDVSTVVVWATSPVTGEQVRQRVRRVSCDSRPRMGPTVVHPGNAEAVTDVVLAELAARLERGVDERLAVAVRSVAGGGQS